jgi:hypothetical protein
MPGARLAARVPRGQSVLELQQKSSVGRAITGSVTAFEWMVWRATCVRSRHALVVFLAGRIDDPHRRVRNATTLCRALGIVRSHFRSARRELRRDSRGRSRHGRLIVDRQRMFGCLTCFGGQLRSSIRRHVSCARRRYAHGARRRLMESRWKIRTHHAASDPQHTKLELLGNLQRHVPQAVTTRLPRV